MENALADEILARKLLQSARSLYRRLSNELERALIRLEIGEPDPEAKSRAETIRAHRKALQTVLDIEAQFLKDAERPENERTLDVEAAKREINSRLDRQIAIFGTDGVD